MRRRIVVSRRKTECTSPPLDCLTTLEEQVQPPYDAPKRVSCRAHSRHAVLAAPLSHLRGICQWSAKTDRCYDRDSEPAKTPGRPFARKVRPLIISVRIGIDRATRVVPNNRPIRRKCCISAAHALSTGRYCLTGSPSNHCRDRLPSELDYGSLFFASDLTLGNLPVAAACLHDGR